MKHDAFLLSGLDQDEGAEEAWRLDTIAKSPTFYYWDTVLRFELLGLIFVRAHRECRSIESYSSVVFSLDHHNYARWIPIHIRDMESLPASVHQEFEKHGYWVVQKTSNHFSAIPIIRP